MRCRPALILPAAALLLLPACGGGDDAESEETPGSGTTTSAPADPETDASDDETDGSDEDAEAAEAEGDEGSAQDSDMLVARDGVWQLGEAGEVEFTVDGGALRLDDVRPADGWTVTDREETPQEIEVELRRGEVEYEIEVELENGILEIEIDQDIDPAEPGSYDVGEAGVVEFAVESGALELVDVTENDGWTVTDQEVEADEIEVEFRRGAAEWEIDVDLDSGGVLDVEIDFEVVGPVDG